MPDSKRLDFSCRQVPLRAAPFATSNIEEAAIFREISADDL